MSISKSLSRPKELSALLKLKFKKRPELGFSLVDEDNNENLKYCFDTLDKVSRSFAGVIRQLPEELSPVVCIFYLTLRALDSVEDDMSCPSELKFKLLNNFHEVNYMPDWNIKGIGDKPEYQELLENYEKVAAAFSGIDPKYQDIITTICRKMGHGMASFMDRKIVTVEDYDLYCHYVAGLVGIGLSQLFFVSELAEDALRGQEKLSNSMGLFLQKTNIIRDYCEDLEENRIFWPEEVWKKYTKRLEDFHLYPEHKDATACLNELVNDALGHVGDCLDYLKRIQNPKTFRFCAIPQAMAIATLAEVYNNSDVFVSTVKIRKGLAAKLMLGCNCFEEVKSIFFEMASKIEMKIPHNQPNSDMTLKLVKEIKDRCSQ